MTAQTTQTNRNILPVFQDYRAPRAHEEVLISPQLDEASGLLEHNRNLATQYPAELAALREPARDRLVRDARRYTSAYADIGSGISSSSSIVMAGHQPTVFHPGVWFKNHALDHIATKINALAINLVVDSDVAGASAIRVPHLIDGKIAYTSVAYDRRGGGVPYEQALVEDRDLFDRFDDRVTEAVKGVVDDPLVGQMWKHARSAIERCGYAGCALAQARHGLEHELGIQTLEVPQSVVCRDEAFAAFAMRILVDIKRFHECYNRSADLYREAHGIRSNAHPVPNLKRDGDWYEAPFWVYGNQSPKRRAVWVRISAGGGLMEISDRESRHKKIDSSNEDSAAEAFSALASPEFKVRSRALITTMYARLVLSDLFLHGIGGGKYDQLGDLISGLFWGISTPRFMAISATILLPGHDAHSPIAAREEMNRVKRQWRDAEFQPERLGETNLIPVELIEQKQSLIDSIPSMGCRAEWHQEVTRLNHTMSSYVAEFRSELERERSALETELKQSQIWSSREHSFCIYPLNYLQQSYQKMLS